ncbi:MAG: hypothetical protein IPM06_20490 [Rhizobiales bacterium]|nr:hypothetical protein [Hyphomicrobiales bacterium]
MLQVLRGEKKLLRSKDVRFAGALPKLSQLQIKKIWPAVLQDRELLAYMPDVDAERLPPRNFFFQILSTVRPDMFNKLLSETESERKKKKVERNEIVKVLPEIWKELDGIRLEKTFVSNPASRRIVKVSKKRLTQ